MGYAFVITVLGLIIYALGAVAGASAADKRHHRPSDVK